MDSWPGCRLGEEESIFDKAGPAAFWGGGHGGGPSPLIHQLAAAFAFSSTVFTHSSNWAWVIRPSASAAAALSRNRFAASSIARLTSSTFFRARFSLIPEF